MTALSRRSFLATTARAAALAAAGGSLAACSSGRDGRVRLELFQFKSEAIGLFDRICADFNAANPDIEVTQNFQADNVTALRVRLVKGDMPDLVTINADYNYGALARTGVFHDFAGSDRSSPPSPTSSPASARARRGRTTACPSRTTAQALSTTRTSSTPWA